MPRILLVKDNEMNRDMLSRRLQKRGFEVVMAVAGDRERALAAGCDDFDTKPVELPRLLAKIETLLEVKKDSWGREVHA